MTPIFSKVPTEIKFSFSTKNHEKEFFLKPKAKFVSTQAYIYNKDLSDTTFLNNFITLSWSMGHFWKGFNKSLCVCLKKKRSCFLSDQQSCIKNTLGKKLCAGLEKTKMRVVCIYQFNKNEKGKIFSDSKKVPHQNFIFFFFFLNLTKRG